MKKIKTSIRMIVATMFALLGVFPQSTSYGWPPAHDPTTPSSQITERLLSPKPNSSVQDKGEKKPNLRRLRIRAMVFRTRDHGTALVSIDDSKSHLIQLRRSSTHDEAHHLNIGGMQLRVVGFSESSITLQKLDTKEQFVIN